MLDRPAKVAEEERPEICCDPLANQNALNRDVTHIVRQRVGWHLPAAHPQPVRKVKQRVPWSRAVLNPPGDCRNTFAWVPVASISNGPKFGEFLRKVRSGWCSPCGPSYSLRGRALGSCSIADDLPGRAREVDRECWHVAAEIVHAEDEVLRQILRRRADHPACA